MRVNQFLTSFEKNVLCNIILQLYMHGNNSNAIKIVNTAMEDNFGSYILKHTSSNNEQQMTNIVHLDLLLSQNNHVVQALY